MAGLSSRFTEVGMKPKYTLPINETEKMFDFALKSFEQWFNSAKFIIVVKDDEALSFVKERCDGLNVKDYEILNLGQTTRGQAETAYLGLCEYHCNESDEKQNYNRHAEIKNEYIRRAEEQPLLDFV